jgi:hypothetical protein
MPHIVTQYYGFPFTIIRGDEYMGVRTMLVGFNHQMDIVSANEMLQTSKRMLTTEDDLRNFYEQYCSYLDGICWPCTHIMSTHPDSIIVEPDKKAILIPSLVLDCKKARFDHVRTENFLIPGKSGMYVLLMEMQKKVNPNP